MFKLFFLLIISVFAFGKDKLIFGMDPAEEPQKIIGAYKPLIDLISKEIGIPIEIKISRDYGDLVKRFEEGAVDFSNIGANNYVNLKSKLPNTKYIATNMELDKSTNKPSPFYTSIIIVKDNSPIKKIGDLKNKKFAFTDKDSTSGYVFPKAHLMKNGLNPNKDFEKVFMLKKHDKVVEAVAKGSVESGATYGGIEISFNQKSKDKVRVIDTIGPIPLEPFVASEFLDEKIVEKIKKVLISIKPDNQVLLAFKKELDWDVLGFEVKSDSFYDIIRETQNILKE